MLFSSVDKIGRREFELRQFALDKTKTGKRFGIIESKFGFIAFFFSRNVVCNQHLANLFCQGLMGGTTLSFRKESLNLKFITAFERMMEITHYIIENKKN